MPDDCRVTAPHEWRHVAESRAAGVNIPSRDAAQRIAFAAVTAISFT